MIKDNAPLQTCVYCPPGAVNTSCGLDLSSNRFQDFCLFLHLSHHHHECVFSCFLRLTCWFYEALITTSWWAAKKALSSIFPGVSQNFLFFIFLKGFFFPHIIFSRRKILLFSSYLSFYIILSVFNSHLKDSSVQQEMASPVFQWFVTETKPDREEKQIIQTLKRSLQMMICLCLSPWMAIHSFHFLKKLVW